MSDNPSQRIVTFIGHLLPLYVEETVNGVQCARSLSDGTLILPIDDPQEAPEGFVAIHWQGDPTRRTEVQGVFIASVAVARYTELHHTGTYAKDLRAAMESMSHHFTVKTGESLVFEGPEFELLNLIAKAVDKVGTVALIEILKKAAGL
jgi:hypothetical protein